MEIDACRCTAFQVHHSSPMYENGTVDAAFWKGTSHHEHSAGYVSLRSCVLSFIIDVELDGILVLEAQALRELRSKTTMGVMATYFAGGWLKRRGTQQPVYRCVQPTVGHCL